MSDTLKITIGILIPLMGTVLGSGMVSGQTVGKSAAGEIGLMWLLTFPACLFLGWLTARLVLG